MTGWPAACLKRLPGWADFCFHLMLLQLILPGLLLLWLLLFYLLLFYPLQPNKGAFT